MRTIESTYTSYQGKNGMITVFRSYLESKWAYLFDSFGLTWAYEPAIIHLSKNSIYIPDFFIKDVGFIEIKPTVELLRHETAQKLQAASNIINEKHTNLRILSLATPSPFFGRLSPTFEFIQWMKVKPTKLSKQDMVSLLQEVSPVLQTRGLKEIDHILEGLINQANHLQEPPIPIGIINQKLIYNFGLRPSEEIHNLKKNGEMERVTLNKIVVAYFEEIDNQIQEMFSLTA